MPTKSNEKRIYAIAGPTASGKTALSVRLAKHIRGEVVNFDSVQIYRGIEIATAKPTAEERQGVPHHLIDYVDPNTIYTAAEWARDASEKIREIESRGNVPILVGGTGFYLRTLRTPLFESPKTDQELRERLRSIVGRRGAAHLHKMLSRVDPAAARKLFANDSARVIRALEVYFQTGTRISELQPKRIDPPEFAGRIHLFVIEPPREELYRKINLRAADHFEKGLVDEVQMLLAAGVREDASALGSHGYRRVCEHLRGERTLASAIEKTQQDVRNYAKRQLTWYRREPDARWIRAFGDTQTAFDALISAVNGREST